MSIQQIARRGLMGGAGSTIPDMTLICDTDITIPAQTSAAQTLEVSFSTSGSYARVDAPFLVELEYRGTTPSTPEKTTLVKAWFLCATHANWNYYAYIYGAWGSGIKSDDTIATGGGSDYFVTNQVTVSYIRNSFIALQIKATNVNGALAAGTWHIRVFKLGE